MKTRGKLLDNKGAAMVTILIAVTFMTILATSLMYMAYMNYLTKSMRYSATDNFYTDEFALDDLATTLQQIAAEAHDITAAKQDIVNAVGNETNNGFPIYNYDKVRSLIRVAGQEASISVNCALVDKTTGQLSEKALIVENSYITLKGVMLTATTPEGYQSTITADVTISFPNTMPGTVDINDFSVIADSPMDFTNGGSHYYSGNIYVQSRSDEHGNRPPAVKLNNGATVGVLSPAAMIVGDMEIKGRSVLHITGDMTVYGTIYVETGSVLICSGTLRHEGISGGGTLKGTVNSTGQEIPMHDSLRQLIDNNEGLVGSLFQEVYIYGQFQSSPSDLGWHEWTLEDFTKKNENVHVQDGNIHCWVMGQSQTHNASETQYNNALILSTQDMIFNGQFDNTTVMTTGTVQYRTEQGTTYMERMADEDYEIARNMTFQYNTNQHLVRRNPNNPTTRDYFSANFGSGSLSDSAVQDTYKDDAGTSDERVFKYGNDNKNYFPIRHFIVNDASSRLTNILGAPTGQQDPAKSYITYELWSKD